MFSFILKTFYFSFVITLIVIGLQPSFVNASTTGGTTTKNLCINKKTGALNYQVYYPNNPEKDCPDGYSLLGNSFSSDFAYVCVYQTTVVKIGNYFDAVEAKKNGTQYNCDEISAKYLIWQMVPRSSVTNIDASPLTPLASDSSGTTLGNFGTTSTGGSTNSSGTSSKVPAATSGTKAKSGDGALSTYKNSDIEIPAILNPIGDKANSLPEIILLIVNLLFLFISMLAVIMIVIAGFQMVVSSGSEAAVTTAKNRIKWSLAGLAVALLSYAMINLVYRLI